MRNTLLVLIVLLLPTVLAAQRYHLESYLEKEGLPSPVVHAVTQSDDGLMWFACRSGLVSYDGNRWTSIDIPWLDDTKSIPFLGNTHGVIWCVANDRVLWREGDSWVMLPPISRLGKSQIRAVSCLYDQGELTFAVATGSGKLHLWRDGVWSDPHLLNAISKVSSGGGCFWIATEDGLIKADRSGIHSLALEFPDKSVHGVLYDDGVLWVAGTTWVARVQGEDVSVVVDDVDIVPGVSFAAVHLEVDGTGGVFIAPPNAVLHYHSDSGLEEIVDVNGQSISNRTSLFVDREKVAWMSSPRGVFKLISRRLAFYDRDHGLFDDEVSAVLQRRNGETVLGHNGGLTVLGKSRQTISIGSHARFARVMDIAEGVDKQLWIACELIGLLRMNLSGEVERHVEMGEGHRGAHTVHVDAAGDVWFGTLMGLFKLVDDQPVPITLAVGERCPVRRITESSDGTLWVSSASHGVFSVKDGHVEQYSHQSEGVRSAYTTLEFDGEVLVGTRHGLCRIDRHTHALVVSDKPRFGRPVYALVADKKGHTWIGSNNGVSRWDGVRLDRFDARRGFIGTEVNRAALEVDSSGHVWVGTDRGVAVYRGERDVDTKVGPSLEIDGVVVDGVDQAVDTPLSLPPETRSIEFKLRVISFIGEKDVLFQTKLEGFDEEWSSAHPIPDRTVSYSNLKPGQYDLRVRAIDVEGRVSPEVRSQQVQVSYPLLQQAWFVTLMIVLGISLVALVVSLRNQRQHSALLKAEVAKATSNLRALEREQAGVQRLESLGLLAGGIAHDFNNLLTAILGNLSLLEEETEEDTDARVMVDNAQAAGWRAQSLTNQLLTFSHGGAPVKRVSAIEDVIRESASFALRGSQTQCEFDMEEPLWAVDLDAGQMSQVLHNLMINAREAMPCGGKVVVRARNCDAEPMGASDGRRVVVEVEDDGVGIPADVAEHIFEPYFTTKAHGTGLGLATANSIVRKHGGVLSLEPTSKPGSTFRIQLPASEIGLETEDCSEPSKEKLAAKVLIMDDDDTVRQVVARFLEAAGCSVMSVADGEDAVALFCAERDRGESYDVVIMDLTVPGGMGGREATERLLAIEPSAKVIVTSGYSDDATLADYSQHGFVGRVPKPFRPLDLVNEVSRVLRGE